MLLPSKDNAPFHRQLNIICNTATLNFGSRCIMRKLVFLIWHLAALLVPVQGIVWKVQVSTSNIYYAGTHAGVFIELYGNKGKSGPHELDDERNNFERGQTDIFKIQTHDIGKLCKIRIFHDNSGYQPWWHLDKVEIKDVSEETTYVFSCNCEVYDKQITATGSGIGNPIPACCPGSYGSNCEQQCGHCKYGHDTCHSHTGTCPHGCEDGYQSTQCNIQCPAGYFGASCNQICGNCANGRLCDSTTGVCPNGCDSGWKGDNCKSKCSSEYFGRNCTQKCGNCANKTSCDSRTGYCLKGCDDGWQGDQCIVQKFIGLSSSSSSSSSSTISQNGLDIHISSECTNGYFGSNCTQKCGNCANKTSCSSRTGYCPDGCDDGWRGDQCNVFLPRAEKKTMVMIIIVAACTTTCIAAIINVFVVWRSRRRRDQQQLNGLNNDPLPQPPAVAALSSGQVSLPRDVSPNLSCSVYEDLRVFREVNIYEDLRRPANNDQC